VQCRDTILIIETNKKIRRWQILEKAKKKQRRCDSDPTNFRVPGIHLLEEELEALVDFRPSPSLLRLNPPRPSL
jgi:hypothetical protein